MHHKFESFVEAAEGLKKRLPAEFVPQIGIVCGSGLSGLQEAVTGPRIEIPYSEIKGFPVSTGKLYTVLIKIHGIILCSTLTTFNPVHGHAGVLVFGFIGVHKTPVVLMNGRAQ